MVALWFFFASGGLSSYLECYPCREEDLQVSPNTCSPQPFALGRAGWIALHGMTSGGRTIQPEEDLTNSGCPPGPILRDTHLHMHACASWMASGLPVAKLYARGWNTPRGFTVTHVSARLATLARRAIHVGTSAIALITAVCLMGTWPGCRRSV